MVLEAYGAAVSGVGATRVQTDHADVTTEIPAYKPVAHPNPAPGYEVKQAPAADLDTRGVPWHVDHHSSSKKQSKGAWDRKRGHDKAAANAYEAQFVGKSTAAPTAAPQVATMANIAATPSMQAPAATLVTVQQFHDLWVYCCQNNKVTMDDQNFIVHNWGAHPMVEGDHWNDGLKRSQAFAFLSQKANA